jgi:AmpD protein
MTPEQYNQAEITAGRLTPEHIVELVAFWQEKHGLTADGKAGPKTRASIDAANASIPAPLPTDPVTGHPEPPAAADLVVDDEGWLRGSGVTHVPSPRNSALDPDLGVPAAIVWHHTSTDHGTADSLARRISKAPGSDDRRASWHILIAADGRIIQSISCERGSWHAGSDTAKSIPVGGRQRRANRCSTGIELEGHGHAPLPAAQVDAAGRVLRALSHAYGIEGRDRVWTHAEIDPTRRSDPGPHWLAALKTAAGLA